MRLTLGSPRCREIGTSHSTRSDELRLPSLDFTVSAALSYKGHHNDWSYCISTWRSGAPILIKKRAW